MSTIYYDALQSETWISQTHRTEQLTTAEGSLIVRPFMFMITNTIVSSVHEETEVQVEAMNWSIDWAVFQEVKRSIMHVYAQAGSPTCMQMDIQHAVVSWTMYSVLCPHIWHWSVKLRWCLWTKHVKKSYHSSEVSWLYIRHLVDSFEHWLLLTNKILSNGFTCDVHKNVNYTEYIVS